MYNDLKQTEESGGDVKLSYQDDIKGNPTPAIAWMRKQSCIRPLQFITFKFESVHVSKTPLISI